MPTARLVTIALIVAVSIGAFVATYVSDRFGAGTGQVMQGGSPKIGGPIALVDHSGEPVSSDEFGDRYRLVFFGYTFCPDVCPVSLSKISTALDLLGDDAGRIVPLFVTVDPARDTPEHMKEYVSFFHPGIVGLTGSDEQIAAVAKAYGVYYAKVEMDEDDPDPDAYLMDHTSITYLMNPDDTYAHHFSHGIAAEEMADGIRRILAND